MRSRRSVLLACLLTAFPVFFSLIDAPPTHAYVDPSSGTSSARSVIRGFDKPEHNWLPGHRGVDLALEIGAPVLAAEDGVVAFAGTVAGTPTVSIDHPDGIRTTYQPVYAIVEAGQTVLRGEVIGRLGSPTTAYPGLQWGARRGRDYINPLSLLARPTIRLKPIGVAAH